MKGLYPEASLEFVDAGRKLLVSAEELVKKLFRRRGQVSLAGYVEHVHEFHVVGPVHSSEHTAQGRAL